MPTVNILGLSENTTTGQFALFRMLIQRDLASIKELGVEESQVSVFFSIDQYHPRQSKEIVILIFLHQKSERTDEVIRHMADTVERQIRCFYPRSLIKVLPRLIDPKHCSRSAD